MSPVNSDQVSSDTWMLDTKQVFSLVVFCMGFSFILPLILTLLGVYNPSSFTLSRPWIAMGILIEYLPLTFTIYVLVLWKLDRIEQERYYEKTEILLLVASALFSGVIIFWVIDARMSNIFTDPYYLEGMGLLYTRVIFHIALYNLASLTLIVTTFLLLKKEGLKVFLPVFIIPAFYSFNADLILNTGYFPSFSIFLPLYHFVLEFGRIETIIVGGILNLLGFQATVFAQNFPFILVLKSGLYSIELGCIGWEGIMGYTIIFLNLLVEMEKTVKMRVVLGVLGLVGTVFVNILRLTLIFIVGELLGANTATVVHSHLGDVIFVVWIFSFVLFIDLWKRIRPVRILDRLKSL